MESTGNNTLEIGPSVGDLWDNLHAFQRIAED